VSDLLIYIEPAAAFILVEQEVAEQRVMQADWPALIIRDIENGVEVFKRRSNPFCNV
jgi:hypothetical protein